MANNTTGGLSHSSLARSHPAADRTNSFTAKLSDVLSYNPHVIIFHKLVVVYLLSQSVITLIIYWVIMTLLNFE